MYICNVRVHGRCYDFQPHSDAASDSEPTPQDSFAWRDNTLEKELKTIRKKNRVQGKSVATNMNRYLQKC